VHADDTSAQEKRDHFPTRWRMAWHVRTQQREAEVALGVQRPPDLLYWSNPEVATTLVFLSSITHAAAGVLALAVEEEGGDGFEGPSASETTCALLILVFIACFLAIEGFRIYAFYLRHGRKMWWLDWSEETDDILLWLLSCVRLVQPAPRLQGFYRPLVAHGSSTVCRTKPPSACWRSCATDRDRFASLGVWVSGAAGGFAGVTFMYLRTVVQVGVAVIIGVQATAELSPVPTSPVPQASLLGICGLQVALGAFSLVVGPAQDRLEGLVVGLEGVLSGVSVLLVHLAWHFPDPSLSTTAADVLIAALCCPLALCAYDAVVVPVLDAWTNAYTRRGCCLAIFAVLTLPCRIVVAIICGSVDIFCSSSPTAAAEGQEEDSDIVEAASSPEPAPAEAPPPVAAPSSADPSPWDDVFRPRPIANIITVEAVAYLRVVKLQAAIRRVQATKRVQHVRLEAEQAHQSQHAILLIQAAWRRGRTPADMSIPMWDDMLDPIGNLIAIETTQYVQPEWLQAETWLLPAERVQAVRRIQAAWRRARMRREAWRQREERHAALIAVRCAVKLQARARRRAAERRVGEIVQLNLLRARETTAVTKLQRVWWRRINRPQW